MKDDLLIKHIRAGDEDAAEELVRRYYSKIMRFCRWQCGDIDLAEDLTQDTFYKALRCLDQYRKGDTCSGARQSFVDTGRDGSQGRA